MTDKLLSEIQNKYPLTQIDAGEFAVLRANGMKFDVSVYKAEGLGHVSVMRAKGLFGLMRMDTLIINPTEIDLPLYSYDRIIAMGNDTLIVELYDTLTGKCVLDEMDCIKQRYSALSDRDPGEHWYDSIKLPESISKKGKKTETEALDSLASEHFCAYLSTCADAVSDRETKRQKGLVYVNGLLEKGGPSTDVFKRSLGKEKTERLFFDVLFGCGK